MAKLSAKLRSLEGNRLAFWCPGCDYAHHVRISDGTNGGWTWNNDVDKPTFSPSVLVTYDGRDAGTDDAPPEVCHSFVVDGQIQFLADCTHALANQTVALPERW